MEGYYRHDRPDAPPGPHCRLPGRSGSELNDDTAVHIAPGAIVDSRAEIEPGVYVGPYCVIGPDVRIGSGTRLENNVTLMGRVTLGRNNHVFPNAVIGGDPQDLSYRGTDTQVIIGDGNIIRECVTINRASEKEEGITQVGDHNMFMACCHVAHDCQVGSHVLIANGTLLGGHVHVHDNASLSGSVAVHHYATIGSYAFVSGLSRVPQDVPPFMLVEGHPSRPRCINTVALRRHNFDTHTIQSLAEAHRLLYRLRVGLEQAQLALQTKCQMTPAVQQLMDFILQQQQGRHGRSRERRRAA